jgi:hypothetical protein
LRLISNTVTGGTAVGFVVWTGSDLVVTPLGFLDAETIVTFVLSISRTLDSWAVFDSVSALAAFTFDHTFWTGVDRLTITQARLTGKIWALDGLFIRAGFELDTVHSGFNARSIWAQHWCVDITFTMLRTITEIDFASVIVALVWSVQWAGNRSTTGVQNTGSIWATGQSFSTL